MKMNKLLSKHRMNSLKFQLNLDSRQASSQTNSFGNKLSSSRIWVGIAEADEEVEEEEVKTTPIFLDIMVEP